MYLPQNAGQPDLVKLFVEMFGLVMPEKIAEEVVKRDVKDDLRSSHQGTGADRHAVHDQDRGHDVIGG
jgi:hypothetical protein